MNVFEMDHEYVANTYARFPVNIVEGKGAILKDEKGKAYHYLVEETTTGNWNVYIDNNDVQTGNITVQNYVYTGYELPSTGGMGTAPFGVLGGALAVAAALLLVRKRKQNEEE